MEVTGHIRHSLADEHVIGIDPPLRPDQPGVWRRRINPFSGRAISDKALTAEQDMRSGLQRLHGMSMTAGIVDGLAVAAERTSIGSAPGDAWLQLSAGLALARSGEDVTVAATRRINLGAVPIVVPEVMASALRSGADAATVPETPEAPAFGAPSGLDRLAEDEPLATRLLPELPRTLSLTLAEAVERPAAAELPRAAILVAQPVRATIIGRPRDDCPPDPRDDPYSDLQRIDGCRLALYFWPSEMLSRSGGADYSMPPAGAARRNQIAYRIFDMERSLRDSEMHPWEDWGVPLALLGFNDDWTLDFIDRSAVVRKGGAPLPRTAMVPKAGNPQLWQARIEQLVENLTDLPDLDPETLRAALPRIPPSAVLPGSLFDPITQRQSFFPGGFAVTATPIPRSDLELAVRGAASLIPYNMAVADQVELLIAVPDALYEPGLLQRAEVDGAFADAIEEFEANRAKGLVQREFVRRIYDRLMESVSGTALSWSAITSPLGEMMAAGLPAPVNSTRSRRIDAGSAAKIHSVITSATLPVSAGDTLWFWLKVHDGGKLKGLSLRLATPAAEPAFGPGVFWGDPGGLSIGSEAEGLADRKAGDLPKAGKWIRLEAKADNAWLPKNQILAGKAIAGIEFAQHGGDIEFGAFGKTDANGNEITWISDDAPGTAIFRTGDATSAPAAWPWADITSRDMSGISGFGTLREGDGRIVAAVQNFQQEWQQPFLAEDMKRLEEVGLDAYLGEVEAKIAATNDAIDVGFIRARSDIYRVRQFMLGADSASRLVTSPSLADLALRDEGARATSEGISKFIDAVKVRKVEGTVFETPPPPPPPASPAPPSGLPSAPPSRATNFSSIGFNSMLMTNNVSLMGFLATPAPTPAPTATATFMAPLLAAMAPSAPTVSAAAAARSTTALTLAPTPSAPLATFQPVATTVAKPLLANHISLSAPAYIPKDVRAQRPLPGLVERTISVAERLKPSPAVQALEYAIASKASVLQALRTLMEADSVIASGRPPGVPLSDLGVPGFAMKTETTPPPTLATLFADQRKPVADRVYIDLDVLLDNPDKKHESDYFSAAVDAIDNAIAMMRLVEGRIALYESLADRVRTVRSEILALAGSAGALLRSLDVEIEEARHDIATAQMLLSEETARVEALRARRAAILADHVGVIGYRRVRECDARSSAPMQDLLPALAATPVAACRGDHLEAPDELKRYTALLGDAPVKWFPAIAAEVERIDRIEAAREALEHSRKLAMAAPALAFQTQMVKTLAGTARFLGGAMQAMQAQQQTLVERRLTTLNFAAAAIKPVTLLEIQAELKETSTLSDLAAGKHRNPQLTSMAAAEIAGFSEIAACLHAGFAEIAPVIRLAWAEVLSQFDRPTDLDNLAGLPRWGEVPREHRRTMQNLTDYLFSRINRNDAKAVAYVNELVRVAMLLAAYSPVNRLISARLVSEAPARIGSRLTLALDTREARKGMVALIRDASNKLIAKAVIDDVAEGQAGARIVSNFVQVSTIVPSMRIELSAQVGKLV